jgi:hypothetical protein
VDAAIATSLPPVFAPPIKRGYALEYYGRGGAVGRCRGVGRGRGVWPGVTLGVAVEVGVALGVAVGVGETLWAYLIVA